MYEVTAIKYGRQTYPGPAVFWFTRWFEWIELDCYFWLIRGNGLTALVDVGMSQEHADRANPVITAAVGSQAAIEIIEDPLVALQRRGVSPQEVDYIILTHTHLDHISNVAKFPRATYFISRGGLEWIMNPSHPELINPVVVPPDALRFLTTQVADDGRLRLNDDREEILPGITTIRTGGHSIDHQAVVIDSTSGKIGLIVDEAMLYANLEHRIPTGSPFNLLSAATAIDVLMAEADIVVPGHDPLVTDRFPDGRIA